MNSKLRSGLIGAGMAIAAVSGSADAAGNDAGVRHFDYAYTYPDGVNLLGGKRTQHVNTSTLYIETNNQGRITKLQPTSDFGTAIDSEGYKVPTDNNPDAKTRAAVETYLSSKHYFEKHGMCRGVFYQGWAQIKALKNEPSSKSAFMSAFGTAAKKAIDFCPVFDARVGIAKEFKRQGQCALSTDSRGRPTSCGVYLGRE